MSFLDKIFQMIISPDLQDALLPLKIVVVFLSLLILSAIIYFLFRTSYLKEVYLEAWHDYMHWRNSYGPKAIRRKIRESKKVGFSDDDSASSAEPSGVPAPSVPNKPASADAFSSPALAEEELNLKDGRVERTDWERIIDKLESGSQLNYKLALIDADKILNDALKRERKDLSPKFISNVDEVNKVKELLEKMLENPGAKLDLEEAKKVIAVYQKALSELKVI